MAWIQSHEEIGDHPKTLKLAELLNIPVPYAVGLVHLLWHFTLRYAWENGDLRRYSAGQIGTGVKWDGDALVLLSALKKSGFLTRMKVHDWSEYSGRLVHDRLRYKLANTIRTESVRKPYVDRTLTVAKSRKIRKIRQDFDVKDSTILRGEPEESALGLVNGPAPPPKASHADNCACELCWPKIFQR